MGVPRNSSGRPRVPTRADPPPPSEPQRTGESVAGPAARGRPGSPSRSGKARTKQQRERAAARARRAAAQRPANLSRQHAGRTTDDPPQPAAAPVPRILAPATVFPTSTQRDPVLRRPPRQLRVVLASAALAVAVGLALIAVTDPFRDGVDGSVALGAGPTVDPGGARGPGGYVRSTITPEGRLVTEHTIVSPWPVTVLRFQLRSVSGFGGVTPVLERLRVIANSRLVFDSAKAASPAGQDSIVLGASTRKIRLRYVTRASVPTTQPAPAGRALVLANPLDVNVGEQAATDRGLVRIAGGGQVLSAACVSGKATPQPCGRPVRSGWRVHLDRSAAVGVIAQVDLPTA